MERRRRPRHIYAAAALAGLVAGGVIVAIGMLDAEPGRHTLRVRATAGDGEPRPRR